MNKKESAKKQKTKKELLEELTALRQALENVQSTQTDLRKDKEVQEEACLRLFREKSFSLDKSLFTAVGP